MHEAKAIVGRPPVPNTEHDSDALGALIERLEKAEAGSIWLDISAEIRAAVKYAVMAEGYHPTHSRNRAMLAAVIAFLKALQSGRAS